MPISQHSIQVWIVCVSTQKIERWRTVLSESERQRALRFRMPADQARFTVTRGVLRTLLARYLLQAATDIEFSANENGKPAIAGQLRFNVTHSGDYALLAFAQDIEVGVDVEHIKGNRVVDDLARRVLSISEYERFNLLAETDRRRTFFQIWTLKEAVLKALGSGLSIAPECTEVSFYPAEERLLSCAAIGLNDIDEWTVRSVSIGDADYAAAIAARGKIATIEIKHFGKSEAGAMYDS